MKTIRLILPLLVAAFAASAVQAAETKSECCESGCAGKGKAAQQAKASKQQQKIAITGTHIPVAPKVAGNTYLNTVQPVVIFTRTDIERSGARTLGQFLGNRASSVGH